MDEVHLIAWLSEHCPRLWSLLNQSARRHLPTGLITYLSPLSDKHLDVIAEVIPELSPGYRFSPYHRRQFAKSGAEAGRNDLIQAELPIAKLIDSCGLKAVKDAYSKDLSGVDTGDKLAEILCEISVCASLSAL